MWCLHLLKKDLESSEWLLSQTVKCLYQVSCKTFCPLVRMASSKRQKGNIEKLTSLESAGRKIINKRDQYYLSYRRCYRINAWYYRSLCRLCHSRHYPENNMVDYIDCFAVFKRCWVVFRNLSGKKGSFNEPDRCTETRIIITIWGGFIILKPLFYCFFIFTNDMYYVKINIITEDCYGKY